MTSNSHFRRGQSKVYYASDVWDPGEEELARTSFRSSCSDHEHAIEHHNRHGNYGNNDDFVASLIRRRNGCESVNSSIYQDDGMIEGEEELLEDDELDTDEFIEEPFSLPTYAKPLPLLGHPSRHSVLNRSAELDDILEEESDDDNSSASPPVISSPSSNSPDGSFRLPGSSSRHRNQQVNTESTSSASSTDGRVGTPPLTSRSKGPSSRSSDHRGPNSKHLNKKLNPGQQNSNKSHDSGFSDSAASDIVLNGTGLSGLGPLGLGHHRDDRATSSQSLSQGSKPDSSEEDQPHCEVVHETRSSSGSKSGSTISNKQYHVSKVYFYSVSDVLQQEGSSPIETNNENESEQHVSILDCETGRVRRGYAQPNSYTDQMQQNQLSPDLVQTRSNDLQTRSNQNRGLSPILFPPLSPPLSHRINVSTDSDEIPKLDPLACDINYFYDGLLEHKLLPAQASAKNSKIHAGTSSLGRNSKWPRQQPPLEAIETSPPTSPTSSGNLTTVSPPTSSPCTSCRSPSQFPKTNGSLYESLSLGRRCHCEKRSLGGQQRSLRPSTSSAESQDGGTGMNITLAGSASPSISLPSPAWTGTAYDSFDDPLSGSRRSFRSVSDLSLSSSSGPTSPWGQQIQQQPPPQATSIQTSSSPEKSTEQQHNSPPSSVVFWLRELCLVHEAECTIMLQSKPVGGSTSVGPAINGTGGPCAGADGAGLGSTYNQTHLGNFWAGNSKDTIRAIQSRAHAISAVFAKLCKQLGHKGNAKLVSLVQGLSHQVHLFLVEYNKVNHLQLNLPGFKPRNANLNNQINKRNSNSNNGESNVPEDVLHQQRLLMQSCDRLKLTVSRNQPQSEVVDVITQLGATFTKLIELMLSKEIKASVDCLEDVKSDTVLRSSVDNIITLALEGNHLCRLIAKHGGVRSLLTICVDPKRRNVRVNAFRALGTVCCVLEGIMELEDTGGIEILSDTLKDDQASEEEKSEAAGLLAQVTSPWIENNNTIEGLSRHLNDLVQSLTSLSAKTTSAETFLLSTAALANLTFMEASVVPLLRNFSTAKVLVSAINKQHGPTTSSRNSPNSAIQQQQRPLAVSIYIQDQVAAVLANMAANVDCRAEVVKHGGLPLLLQFLLAEPTTATSTDLKAEDYAQLAATERVLQKSAIAISRLCNDKRLAEEVVRLEGLVRLVELCKNESARVGSDGVLVACLAAVRKIAAAVGPEKFKNLDATELVEPRLLDSFLIFSSRNESFV